MTDCFSHFRYGVGFALWNVDNHFCNNLKNIRTKVPFNFLAPFTQLHGWWHILAGYASHLHIQSLLHHRQKFLKDDIVFEITWMGIEGMRKAEPAKNKMTWSSNIELSSTCNYLPMYYLSLKLKQFIPAQIKFEK